MESPRLKAVEIVIDFGNEELLITLVLGGVVLATESFESQALQSRNRRELPVHVWRQRFVATSCLATSCEI